MSSQLTPFKVDMPPSLQMAESELIEVLQNSIYPGAQIASIKMAIGYCRAQNLDPMLKPVHLVPMQVKQRKRDKHGNELLGFEKVWRDVVMPGIGLYRINADRTGLYAGIDEAEFGPEVTEELGGEPRMEWDEQLGRKVEKGGTYPKEKVTYPLWCSVKVYKLVNGQRCAFSSGKVFWKETYATQSADTSLPNTMWNKRNNGQIEKCAEALALRRAFPDSVGSQPTAEEMIGKSIYPDHEIDVTPGAPERAGIQKPQAKAPPQTIEGQSRQAEDPPAQAEGAANSETQAAPAAPASKSPASPVASAGQINMLKKRAERNGFTVGEVAQNFQVGAIEQLSVEQANDALMWVSAGKATA